MIDEADVNVLGSFANFSRNVSEAYVQSGLLSNPELFRVNSFVEGFHDALILFALAVDVVRKIIFCKTTRFNGPLMKLMRQ